MSYDHELLLNRLRKEFDFARGGDQDAPSNQTVNQLGWCHVITAEDRDNQNRPVCLYYPRVDVWSNSAARKLLRDMMRNYSEKFPNHPSLPVPLDLLQGKEWGDVIVLVTARSTEPNLTLGERNSTGLDWQRNDIFTMAQKRGAALALTEAFGLLHENGMSHGSIGVDTLSIRNHGGVPQVQIDFLNFSKLGKDLPPSSPNYEPAFASKEALSDPVGQAVSPTADVCSLGRYLVYLMIGPKGFFSYFDPSPSDADDGQELGTKQLRDQTRWTNLALAGPVLDAQRLVAASGAKLDIDTAELISRAVAYQPETRPGTPALLHHGLQSMIAGEYPRNVVWGISPQQPPPLREVGNETNTRKIVLIAALVLMIVGGAALFLTNQKREAEMAALAANMTEACVGFADQMRAVEGSAIKEQPGWEAIKKMEDRAQENGKGRDTLAENLDLCGRGSELLEAQRASFLAGLRSSVTDAVTLAEGSKVDLTALAVNIKLAEADQLVAIADVPAAEAAFDDLLSKVQTAHLTYLDQALSKAVDAAEKASSLIGGQAESDQLQREIAAAQVVTPSGSDALKQKSEALKRLEQTTASLLQSQADQMISTLGDLSKRLLDAGAAKVDSGFAELQAKLDRVVAEPRGTDVVDYEKMYGELKDLQVEFELILERSGQMEAEVQQLESDIKGAFETIKLNGWQDEPGVVDLVQSFQNWRSSSVFEDHAFLSDLKTQQVSVLSPLRAKTEVERQACRDTLEASRTMDGLRNLAIWDDLAPLLREIEDAGESEGGSAALFAKCHSAKEMVERSRTQLSAANWLDELRATQKSVVDRGAGDFMPAYTKANAALETLAALPLPEDTAAHDLFTQQAQQVLMEFDTVKDLLEKTDGENRRLTDRIAELRAKVASIPELASHPTYLEVDRSSRAAPGGNILERNVRLTEIVASIESVVRRFEAGELLNCNLGTVELGMVELTPEQLGKGSAALRAASPDVAVPDQPLSGEAIQFCMETSPVTISALKEYRDGLSKRDADVQSEIDIAKEGPGGAAQNVTYWLAERYAAHMAERTGMDVCVAPASAFVAARQFAPDQYPNPQTTEIFNETCGETDGTDGLSKRLLVQFSDTGIESTDCVLDVLQLPLSSFRLAAGPVCIRKEN